METAKRILTPFLSSGSPAILVFHTTYYGEIHTGATNARGV